MITTVSSFKYRNNNYKQISSFKEEDIIASGSHKVFKVIGQKNGIYYVKDMVLKNESRVSDNKHILFADINTFTEEQKDKMRKEIIELRKVTKRFRT